MFDEQFNDYLLQTLLSYEKIGYKNYIAYSQRIKVDDTEYMEYHIILSKDSIGYSHNRFNTVGISKSLTLSTSTHKTVSSDVELGGLTVTDYECLMSNAKDFEGTNALALVEYNTSVIQNNQFDYIPLYATNVILCAILCLHWLKMWFGKMGEVNR